MGDDENARREAGEDTGDKTVATAEQNGEEEVGRRIEIDPAGVGAVEEQVGPDDHDGDEHGIEGDGFRTEDDAQGHAGRVAGGESEDRRFAISETKLGFYFGSRRRRLPVTGRSRTRARTAFCAAELTEAKAYPTLALLPCQRV